MLGRKTRRARADAWVVTDISDQAQQAAADAARNGGVPLEIWLAETVLRACQEGIEGVRKEGVSSP